MFCRGGSKLDRTRSAPALAALMVNYACLFDAFSYVISLGSLPVLEARCPARSVIGLVFNLTCSLLNYIRSTMTA